MFGFSFTKLLVLVAVIAIFWRGIGMLERWQRARELEKANAKEAERSRVKAPKPDRPVTDLVACPRCGAYVPADHRCPRCGPTG